MQDNKHGKRANAMLKSVQFLRDGESFGAAPVNPDDEFDDDMVGEVGSIGDDGDDSYGEPDTGGDDDVSSLV
jgi:hypothetical protein